MNKIPKYLKLLEENLYACEICHAFLSTDEMIKSHQNDIYHKEKVFELRQKVKKYEVDNLLKKRSEFKDKKLIYLSEKKVKVENNLNKIHKKPNFEGIFQKREKNEIEIENNINFNNENKIGQGFKEEYINLIQNQEENLYDKKRNLIKQRLKLLRQKKLKKNN